MKQTILFIIFIQILMSFNILFAKTIDSNKSTSIKVLELKEVKKSTPLNKDIGKENLYKLLYENSVKSNNNVNTTMQWAIGFVATFIMILLGSQIFFNYRISKEEVKAIRSSIEEKISTMRVKITDEQNKKYLAYNDSIRASFENLENDLRNIFIKQLDAREKYFNTKIESFEKSIEILKNDFDYESNNMLMEMAKINGEIWKLKGVEANALVSFIDTAFLTIDRGHEAKYILNEITEILEKITRISKNEVSRLEKLILKIPENNIHIGNKIQALYKPLPQYMFVDDPKSPGDLKIVNI